MATTVFAVDISLSMAKSFSDLVPSKLEAVLDSVLTASKRLIENRGRVGLVVYAAWAVPIVFPTTNLRAIYNAVSNIDRTYEGSAPGDAIVESVKLLRSIKDSNKRIVLVTDGDYNIGVPLGHSLLYARSMGVETSILLLGSIASSALGKFHTRYKEYAEWVEISNKRELLAGLLKHVEGS